MDYQSRLCHYRTQSGDDSISPGWVGTASHHGDGSLSQHSQADEAQHPAGRVGRPEDIAEMVLFLCDDHRAGFITGENIIIDGSMSKLMVYHDDRGWTYGGES